MLDFEKCFSDWLDRSEYDNAESALYAIVRLSFKAGWQAAGGDPPKPLPVAELLRPKRANVLGVPPDSMDTDI